MTGVYSAVQTALSEKLTMEREHIGETELIERAGRALAEEAARLGKPVVCVCGGGKNGADGIAAARFLREAGGEASVLLATDRRCEEGEKQLGKYVRAGGWFCRSGDEHILNGEGIILDAILGTGLNRPISDRIAALTERINASGAYVIACDIPTGICAEDGRVMGGAVRANKTVTFSFSKFGHILFPGREYSGQTVVRDIGLVPVPGAAMLTEEGDAKRAFGKRRPDAYKGDYGRTAVLGGSVGLMGAGIMAASAALRAGGGMVTLGYPATMASVYETGKILEVMSCPLPDAGGGFSRETTEAARTLLSGKDAFAIGPGLGRAEETRSFVRELLNGSTLPAVIDADALFALPKTVIAAGEKRVLTPHAGEMARLAGISVEEVTAEPVRIASSYAAFCGATVLLKGATTTAAAPDGRIALIAEGTPALAKAGSGDVLTGLILSLLGRGFDAFTAAYTGAFVHGRAGRIAERKLGEYAVCATDLIACLPEAIASL